MAQAVGTVSAMDALRHARRARRRTGAARAAASTARCCPARAAASPSLPQPLHAEVVARTRRRAASTAVHPPGRGDRPAARAARSVVVATGTASGKSLCYQLPIVDVGRARAPRHRAADLPHQGARAGPAAVAAVVARARVCARSPTTATPPADDRAWARKNANVVLTNPEMLHMGILPSHKRWATFLMRLRYVVVDELHTLRGIFGSHVAHVLRRLRRAVRALRLAPDVLLRERDDRQPRRARVARCAGCRSKQIDDDGSPQRRTRARVLATAAARRALGRARVGQRRDRRAARPLRRRGHQTLAFTRSRRGAELVAQHAPAPPRRHVGAELADRVAGVPRRLPARGAAGARDATSRAASCSASRPRTRSSSASTSAASTRWCSTASPARSRRCGSRPDGPGAPAGGRRPCSSPATTSSTSGTPRTPTS